MGSVQIAVNPRREPPVASPARSVRISARITFAGYRPTPELHRHRTPTGDDHGTYDSDAACRNGGDGRGCFAIDEARDEAEIVEPAGEAHRDLSVRTMPWFDGRDRICKGMVHGNAYSAGDGLVDDVRQALPCEAVEHTEDADAAAAAQVVGREVHRPVAPCAIVIRAWAPRPRLRPPLLLTPTLCCP